MSTRRVGKTLGRLGERILKVFKEGLDAQTAGGDREEFERDRDQLGRGVEKESADAARDEVKESLSKHATGIGMSAAEAELWFEHNWKKLIDSSEAFRRAKPQAEEFGRFFWLKALGVVAVAGWAATAVTGARPPKSEADRMIESVRTQSAERDQMESFIADEAQFSRMVDGLEPASPPAPRSGLEPIAALAAPLPPAVAAVADQPVVVEVDATNSMPRAFESTVGRMYRSVPPPAQHAIEQTVFHIDHGYDHENFDDCAHTHCLGGSFHKDFTVDSPIGSAHFKY